MKCPLDGSELAMSERHGIEIDYCPKCRGVWLDRGELDKIVERAVPDEPASRRSEPEQARERDREHRDDDRRRHGERPYRKRKSLLDDIFDF